MAEQLATVDLTDVAKFRAAVHELATTDKHTRRAVRKGYSRVGIVAKQKLKREVSGQQYPDTARSIGTVTHAKKSKGGTLWRVWVGPRTKFRKESNLWHLLNLGVKPHLIPNAYRRWGNILRKVPGGWFHPGFTGVNMRDAAFRRMTPSLVLQSFDDGFNPDFTKEMRGLFKNVKVSSSFKKDFGF